MLMTLTWEDPQVNDLRLVFDSRLMFSYNNNKIVPES